MANSVEEKKCLTVLWRIENFNYCIDEVYKSPYFQISVIGENDSWYLKLYPRGKNTKNCIALYLYKEAKYNYSRRMDIRFFLLTADGSPEIEKEMKNCEFTGKYTEKGFDNLVTRKEMYENKHVFLNQGVLSIKCCIYPLIGDMEEGVKICIRSRISVEKFFFNLSIPTFTSEKIDKKCDIPKDPSKNPTKLKLHIHSIGHTSEDEKIVFEIEPLQNPEQIISICKISFLDIKGRVTYSIEDEHIFASNSDTEDQWIFPLFFSKSKLMSKKELLLNNDVMNLQINYSFSDGKTVDIIEETIYEPQVIKRKSLFDEQQVEKHTLHNISLTDDLQKLYKDQQQSDFTLQTSTKNFSVHRCILSARSPVLRAMLENEMIEKDRNVLELVDLDEDTVDKMLLFMYTNEFGDLAWESAMKLYYAADKYQLTALKEMCLEFLMANLTISNVYQIMVLANTHDDVVLKDSTQTFISRNEREVVHSPEWADFIKQNPTLAIETICAMHLKRNEDIFQQF